MSQPTGKVAVVTGPSEGIGALIAEHLAAAEATVIVNHASSRSGADAAVARIVAQGGIATVAVFPASDDAGWVTGQTLILAGGARY